ncbi:MAG: N-formylglutamate amidohydrolase, partial [Candidatus Eremiobacteraeota bacterium]|nr:N-formylglutamate amidohydrolase [Candidatus Eremiobacteraeota bacterium]
MVVLISLLCRPLSAETAPFILEKGDLPILLVAPHGGSGNLLEAPIRRQRDSEDPHFSTKKDMVTSELTRSYCDEILRVTGKKPSLLNSEIHRKYCDLNRQEDWSSPAPAGQAFHREYHRALREELERLVSTHGWALLLDIHGQSSEPHDLMIGVREGDTIGNWSKAALWGHDGLVERLQKEGFAVVPGRAQDKIRYGGGYIVKTYGADGRVEAWQLEHGSSLRFDLERNQAFVRIFVEVLVDNLGTQLRTNRN